MIERAMTEPYSFTVHSGSKFKSCPIPLDIWMTHFRNLLFRENLNTSALRVNLLQLTEENRYLNRPFQDSDVARAIGNTKNRKAAGPNGVAYEHLKLSKDTLLPAWVQLFNKCFEIGRIPDEWRYSDTTVLHKGKGDLLDPNAYRGISKQHCAFKVFCKLLANRLYSQCIASVPDEQLGFLRGRSTLQAVRVLLDFVHQKVYEDLTPVYAVFIDYLLQSLR